MRSASLGLLLLIVFLTTGCATVRTGGPATKDAWYLVAAPHFLVYSDLDEATAARAAQELEATRDALVSALQIGSQLTDLARVRVFVLASPDEFQRSFGPYAEVKNARDPFPALFLHAPVAWGAASPGPAWSAAALLRHEMTHQLIAAAMSRAPLWLEEGLARVMESAQVTTDGRSVTVGSVVTKDRTRFSSLAALGATLNWTEPNTATEKDVFAFSATSQLFVHWLLQYRPESFYGYAAALAADTDPKKAWADTFADLNLREMDETLAAHAKKELAPSLHPLVTNAPYIETKIMTPADVNVAQARVMMAAARFSPEQAQHFEEAAHREIERALQIAPLHVDALAVDTATEVAERRRRSDFATFERADANAYALRADLALDKKDRETYFRRSLELSAEPRVAHNYAVFLLAQKRAEDALPIVERAARQAPSDIDVLETHAAVLLRLGRCVEALEVSRRAIVRAREADRASQQRTRRAWANRALACRARDAKPKTAVNGDAADDAPTSAAAPKPAETRPAGTKSTETSLIPTASSNATPGSDTPPSEVTGTAEGGQSDRDERPTALHSGVSLGIAFGAGYGFGSYAGTYNLSGNLDGALFDANVAIGYWFEPGVSLAIQLGMMRQLMTTPLATLNHGDTDGLGLGYLALLADIYPAARSPFHFQAGAGVLRGGWETEVGVEGSVLPPGDSLTGFLLQGSAGYVWPVFGADAGPTLRYFHCWPAGDQTSATFGAFSLLGSVFF
jgi:tetratricopeptide (TPR) repeat protein